MASRRPTKKQFALLCVLGDPRALLVSGITGNARTWRSLLSRGWIEARDPEKHPENGLRITSAGLRALADGLDLYGVFHA